MQNLLQCNAEHIPLHNYDKLFWLGKDLRKNEVVSF